MLWHLQWGADKVAWFEDIAAETGTVPVALQNQPEIAGHHSWLWRAFQELTHDRAFGLGIGPIPAMAIDAYARRHRIDDADQYEMLVTVIRALDSAYLEEINKKKEGER